MIAGVFAFVPIDQAETVHTTIIAAAGVEVLTLTDLVLDADGEDVRIIFTALEDSNIKEIKFDNTPTCDPVFDSGSDWDCSQTVQANDCDSTLSQSFFSVSGPDDDPNYLRFQCDSAEFRVVTAFYVKANGDQSWHQGVNKVDFADNYTAEPRRRLVHARGDCERVD